MTCHRISTAVIVCGHDSFVNLAPFGANVWCEYHNYLGPSFYRSEKAIAEIRVPSRKTWEAFQRWRDSIESINTRESEK